MVVFPSLCVFLCVSRHKVHDARAIGTHIPTQARKRLGEKRTEKRENTRWKKKKNYLTQPQSVRENEERKRNCLSGCEKKNENEHKTTFIREVERNENVKQTDRHIVRATCTGAHRDEQPLKTNKTTTIL